ncbi:MAG: Lrp/AsnC family transcriptional regulator [Oxalobacteraceae bacterium]|nr:Lrp/AsnC family transcriptional regulator [Oxalobacteraceae bacterium]
MMSIGKRILWLPASRFIPVEKRTPHKRADGTTANATEPADASFTFFDQTASTITPHSFTTLDETIVQEQAPQLAVKQPALDLLSFVYLVIVQFSGRQMDIDRIDARLIAEVQRNNRTPSEELGEAVGLSPTAVQRRLKRLRAEGVIESDVAIVNPKAIGQSVQMVVLVGLERERSDIIDLFKMAIRVTAQIMAGYYVTGDADFVLIVTTEDMERYESFTRSFFYGNPDIQWFKTMVVMDRVKASFALPIDAERFK